ncbi:M20 family peptidase [Flavilitoribacter nigricans]|uniref:Carboxypeptidase n=1 Tax=Flavilitoribacter nigricans (strain ATCC 23147 / DSM 23189 / NBRC 102662 / NCIMB 1420 / SS-2) TaxID=1122177 RepID=A0A2D0NAU9_FLAN2|nr:M20 family peptidase [Flavilitoribacter nigricans]PHN05615.1 carboxypeptidase [Flavilitoribacter nigricans DSM 23189 = NBRC 102662]
MSKSRSPFRRFLRRLFFALLLILGLLALIIWINVIRFSSRQIAVDPIEKVAIDGGVSGRLSAAVQLPTVSYPDHIDTSAFLDLDTLIRRSFPGVDSSLERIRVNPYSQVFRWPGQQSDMAPILLLAHLDVVPVEPEAEKNWSHPPFAGQIADGYIWGRGTLDDKISAFAILEAVEQLLRERYAPNRTIYLAFGHDEEVSGEAGARAISNYFAEQNIRFEYVLDEGQLILRNALAGLEPPLAMIGIAEKGYLTLDLEVELEEGGHSSMPPPATAIGVLARAIDQLQQHPVPARIDGATRGLFEFIGPEMSPLYKSLFANLWLTEPLLIDQLSQGNASNAIIRTTTAPTVIKGGVRANVLPTQAAAQINFRILPGETVESVRDYVEKIIDDERVRVSFEKGSWQKDPSAISGTGTFGFGVIQKTIQQVFPEVVVAPALVIGATDARHYQQVSEQIYRFQPLVLDQPDLSRIHGLDERVSEAGYADAIRFYLQLIRNSSL